MVQDQGNTRPDLPASHSKKQRVSPSKSWCFTYNNYASDQMFTLVQTFKKFDMSYVIGREVGEEGTPHLQGFVKSDKKFRPIEKFGLDEGIHWEKCKGSATDNYRYCSKEGDFETNMVDPDYVEYEEPYGWQLQVMEIIKEPPHKRHVHWFKGRPGIGKSDLCRYLAVKHGAQICAGKPADMKCQIARCEVKPELIIFDVPLESHDYVSYSGLEELKNGVFASPKYESGMCILPRRPHVIVFSNEFPRYEKLAEDKLVVHDLDEAYDGETPHPGINPELLGAEESLKGP